MDSTRSSSSAPTRSASFPMADSRDAASVYWVEPRRRAVLPLDVSAITVAAQDDPRRSLPRHRRYRLSRDPAALRQSVAGRPETWINAEHRARLHDAARDGLRAFGRMLGRRRAGRRALRTRARPCLFRRIMVSRATDASKVALAHLVARLKRGGFTLLDCQFQTAHLASLGAIEINRDALCRVAGRGARRELGASAASGVAHRPGDFFALDRWRPACRHGRGIGPGRRERHRAALGPDVVDRVLRRR